MRHLAAISAIVLISALLIACGEFGSTADPDLAPDFAATDSHGEQVTLSGLLDQHTGVVMVFYRGFF